MQIEIRLAAAPEIERLRTAAWQFAEVRGFAEPPAVVAERPLAAKVVFASQEAAEAFAGFWSRRRRGG